MAKLVGKKSKIVQTKNKPKYGENNFHRNIAPGIKIKMLFHNGI